MVHISVPHLNIAGGRLISSAVHLAARHPVLACLALVMLAGAAVTAWIRYVGRDSTAPPADRQLTWRR